MPLGIPNYGDWGGDKGRGHHPPACTCFGCNEGQRQKEAAKEEERRAAEYDRQVAKEKAEEQARERAQQASAAPPPPTKPPATRRGIAHPHSYACTCSACGDAREGRHREAQATPTPRPNADAAQQTDEGRTQEQAPRVTPAHAPDCGCYPCERVRMVRRQQSESTRPLVKPPVKPPRVSTAPVRPVHHRGAESDGGSGWLGLIATVVLVAAIFGGIWLWGSDSSESGGSTQAEESSGWFSVDCDNGRRRRRGGWLKQLIC